MPSSERADAGDLTRGTRTSRGRVSEPPATGAAAVDSEPEAESVARAIALRLLTHSPRSRSQLAEAMAKKDVPETVATKVLDRFTEVGLINDAEYAQMLVRSRQSERGLARRALALELRRKGIGSEDAEAALSSIEPEDEEAAARALLRRKARSSQGLDPTRRRRRLMGMLARKGYPAGLAHRLISELFQDEQAEDGVDQGNSDPAGNAESFLESP
ncbi:regulatory protein RecX [Pseudactinotalea sp. Z1748]|uniref:regulatory protein RecX n=1 Tax=Pseudactinotalea sp. Z1748 TaxID=3413027 RepID=UPI003C7C1617